MEVFKRKERTWKNVEHALHPAWRALSSSPSEFPRSHPSSGRLRPPVPPPAFYNKVRKSDTNFEMTDSTFHLQQHLQPGSPLVWAQPCVCRRQERLQVWSEFIQLHGEGGKAVIQQVIDWLGICGVTKASQLSCCTNVTLGFMRISSFHFAFEPFKPFISITASLQSAL